jgi:aldehyde dehydrogenase (NAD+)
MFQTEQISKNKTMRSPIIDEKQINVSAIFEAQRKNHTNVKNCTIEQRKDKLRKLKAAIEAHETEIFAALQKDLRKSVFESSLSETFLVLGEIDFAIKNLSKWASPHKASTNLLNISTKTKIVYEPKGVGLIIAPWNYPFMLILAPLVSAIAAGNCCMLKSSKLAPEISRVTAKLVNETFPENEIFFVEGHLVDSNEILKLPFNHIFFTGSTEVGKLVMEAAAKHLASVTLELGGKTPVIIDEAADLKYSVPKITWGKLLNSGQSCIAPDYAFVHESKKAEFIKMMTEQIAKSFFVDGKINKADYGKIISTGQFNRLRGLVDNAVNGGAKVETGGVFEDADNTIHPTLLSNVSLDSDIMNEEIFGPVLPIISYKNIKEVLDYVNSKSKPLALYVFSDNSKNVDHIVKNTSSGGTCINDVMIQITNPNIPFGGVNASGIGGSHGFFGFKSFSHERAVVYQSKMMEMNKMIYAPYGGKEFVLKMLRKLI